MTRKQRAIVICPGRGTYNKEELGYFHRYHESQSHLLDTIDEQRAANKQKSIRELDLAKTYSMKMHTAGENASSLIYACAKADFNAINKDKFDIVGVTGNSMGWYIACGVANTLNHENASHVINTMGSMMKDGIIGGQSLYPIVDENWQFSPELFDKVQTALTAINNEEGCELHQSIRLGGYMVFGGNDAALKRLKETLPEIDARYPMQLFNHAAFHTPLLNDIVTKAKSSLSKDLFTAPELPLIDGEGQIWQPYSTDVTGIYDYTLGTQVNETYDFTRAIEVAIKEFAPDKLIILGPGATLGGAVAQILIANNWYGLTSKADFIDRQKTDPIVIAMGMENQRNLAIDE